MTQPQGMHRPVKIIKVIELTFPGFPAKILTTEALSRSISGSGTSCVAMISYPRARCWIKIYDE